ncbi:hypothetical protein IQ254_14365 [Nodosilinea sp. LEGE 07088]|uniref:hypothetical protein n=1 Tax=Nodosilinea sp. LEGE 07088 TaxID=2777968 RepID=UPI001881395A|nr:hypothetical protein [Nodosilinea sp. LEGE 07088]MBE9138356.1 hypothetical protein [Nodosilinea sp. LEGE 07088]
MKPVFAAVATWVRNLAIALSCILMLSMASPAALAIGSTPSQPDQGTAKLDGVYNEAEKSVQPENALKGDRVIDRANKGLNEVQKDADVSQMNYPENSKQATSPIDQIKDALSQVTP